MIRFRNVSKSYDEGRTRAVQSLSLTIEAGELLILLGTSGCGKTTTLKMINRLIEPTEGSIEVDGQSVAKRDPVQLRRGIGYVFQGVGLFPHMTVGENIGVVPRLLKWDDRKVRSRTDELLELVNMPPGDYRDRMPHQLSGGQRQRVGLARALAAKPKIMLMDEPFGALDPLTRDTLQSEFRKIHEALDLTSVMVTHDMTEALLLADRIAVMHDGEMKQVATPRDLLRSPENEYVREIMQTPKRQADQLEALAEAADANGSGEKGGEA
ncbi:MAG: ATP-binding cassette domain-containing protein [Phycisphaerales bacterium]|nr:MAG: ATP-binding cassette domain-containing protein [Phycisphaerales bacterium]